MPDDDSGPMTIKSVPRATREKMNACARRRGQTLAYWLTEMVDKAAAIQEGDWIDSTAFEPRDSSGMPAVQPTGETGIPMSMIELREAMEAAAAISRASGVPVPKVAARHCYAMLTKRLRAARGLPPIVPRQTKPQIRQTIEAAD